MNDLLIIDSHRLVVDYQERLRKAGRSGPHAAPQHPVRTWIGHQLIRLGSSLAGNAPATSGSASPASPETEPALLSPA